MEETLTFLFQTLGLGLLTGFVFGFLFKKVAKIVLFLVAVVVVVVIVFGHNEILDIDWLSTKERYQGLFSQYFNHYSDRLKMFMINTPFFIGLIIGGLVGLKKG